jgi:hydroxyethylthiazole kinase-like uncharacterized protein yjeF
MKIVNVSQMQKAERDCSSFGISLDMLMENAGKAAAEEIRSLVGSIQKQSVVIVVGPGNNGGDGLVAARYLFDWGAEVKVYLIGKRSESDLNLVQVQKRNIGLINSYADNNYLQLTKWLSGASIILDAIFGTGKSRAISGDYAQILSIIGEIKKNRPDLKIIAIDLPSGLNADSGETDPFTLQVDNTITLGFPKIGLYNLPGAERAGKISIVDIGIPPQIVDYVNLELLSDQFIRSILPTRRIVSHKGSYGKVLALTGSINYPGAAYLACSGTIRAGAGLTTLAIARSLLPILASKIAEVTYLPLPESNQEIDPAASFNLFKQHLPQYDVLLVGCGIGQSEVTANLVNNLLLESHIKIPKLILDADGINIISKYPDWWTTLKDEAILTPHAGEMARLLNRSIQEVQSNRVELAREASRKWNKIIVLKGAYTVIASPDGRIGVSPFANAGLATAGTGDVLAGTIAGMAAQGLPLFEAAVSGVYLHGLAAEMVKSEMGDAGMLASDLLPMIPRAIRQLKEV